MTWAEEEDGALTETGWAVGICPVCGRVWRRQRPANLVVCDCFRRCANCGGEMTPYTPDMNPQTYRSEDTDDPTGMATKHEATLRTRFHCPSCDTYSDGTPAEVELR